MSHNLKKKQRAQKSLQRGLQSGAIQPTRDPRQRKAAGTPVCGRPEALKSESLYGNKGEIFKPKKERKKRDWGLTVETESAQQERKEEVPGVKKKSPQSPGLG